MAEINFDYLNIFKEPVLFGALIARQTFKSKPALSNGAILVVNTCLVGEFAASLPALHEFIRRHPDKKIDLLVSPPLKTLAERVRGVGAVYTAKSVFSRDAEHHHEHSEIISGTYEKVVAMRISRDAYRALSIITTGMLKTAFWPMTAYGAHMAWRLLAGKTPKSWREVNFEMFGLTPKNFPFEAIFDFTDADYKQLESKFPPALLPKKIIIHTGASWVANRWPTERWIATLRKLHPLGFDFIFVGSKSDKADYDVISSQLNFKTYSLIAETNAVELVLLLRTSQYFIGVDSGPRNFAHLVDLPSITLLGPGPHMYTPPNPRDILLDRSGGRGLSQRFFHQKQRLFIERITPQDVVDAFSRLRTRG